MKYYGLKHERTGEFVYQPAETKTERERRKNGVNEIKKLSRDLKSARNGSLDGFQEFIRVDENIKSFISHSFFFSRIETRLECLLLLLPMIANVSSSSSK